MMRSVDERSPMDTVDVDVQGLMFTFYPIAWEIV